MITNFILYDNPSDLLVIKERARLGETVYTLIDNKPSILKFDGTDVLAFDADINEMQSLFNSFLVTTIVPEIKESIFVGDSDALIALSKRVDDIATVLQLQGSDIKEILDVLTKPILVRETAKISKPS